MEIEPSLTPSPDPTPPAPQAVLRLAAALADCASLAEAELALREMLDDIFQWDAYFLAVYDEPSERFCVVAWCDDVEEQRRCWTGYRSMLRQPDEPELIEQGVPLLINREPENASGSPRGGFGDVSRPSCSLLTVPVRSAGRTIGLFSIQSYTPGKYTTATADFLMQIAPLMAPVIRREQMVIRLRASEERSRFLFDSNPSLVMLLSASLTIMSVNEPGARILGYEPGELKNVPFTQLCANFQAVSEQIDLCRARPGSVLTRTQVFAARDGGPRYLRLTVRSLSEETDKEILILSGQDETERQSSSEVGRRLEFRTRQRRKLETFSVIASGLSHDLSNAVTGIQGNAGLALLDIDPRHPAWISIRRIQDAAATAGDLARSLLSIAGKGRVHRARLSVAGILNAATPHLRENLPDRLQLSVRLPVQDAAVMADADEMRLLLRHLVANAAEAFPLDTLGGTISLSAEIREFGTNELEQLSHHEFLQPGRYACFQITDNGEGMLPRVRERIFDPFFTTRPTGRGLGLAIVLGVVRAHGGGVGVETAPGSGATIQIVLPLAGEQSDSPGIEETTTPVLPGIARKPARVLIGGDDQTLTEGVASLLEVVGHSAVSARTRDEILRALETPPEPDVVLLDCTGAEGETLPLVDEILARRPGARVILLRSARDSDTSRGIPLRPALSLLTKPFTAAELTSAIAGASGGPPAPGR